MYFEINGNKKLEGTINISGAKNSVLALMIATTMTDGIVSLEDAPDIEDVKKLIKILKYLGSNIIVSDIGKKKTITIDNEELEMKELLMPEVSSFRASYYFMGAFAGRYKKCRLSLPGGCYLGPRPIDLHLKGLEQLGYEINRYDEGDSEIIEIDGKDLKGTTVFLDFPSVGATINIILASIFINGEVIIENVAREPEIVDLATLLNNMGASVKGAGTNIIKINGIEKLNGTYHQVIPDRIEAGTYMMMGALLSDNLMVANVIPEHLEALTSKMVELGVDLQIGDEEILIQGFTPKKNGVKVQVGVYPSFVTDHQQIFLTMLTQAMGESSIHETIYPERFRFHNSLNQMGADIKVELDHDSSTAYVSGKTKLHGENVTAVDLRAGASLIFAGLIAEGTTRVFEPYHVLRGYDRIIEKLQGVGADIKLIEEEYHEK